MKPIYMSLRASYNKKFYLPVHPRIITAPVVSVFAGEDFCAVSALQTPPQNVFYMLDGELRVLGAYGEPLFTLRDGLKMADERSVPVFCVDDIAAADSLARFCDDNNLADGSVCVRFERRQVLGYIRRTAPLLRGMLDCREHFAESLTLSDDEIYRLVGDTMESEATMLLLPGTLCTSDIIFKLKKRFIKVWGEGCDPVSAVTAGIAGLITQSPAALYALYDKFPENSLISRVPLYAHKGYHITGEYPENAVSSVVGAAVNGFDAAEIDIKLTSDERIVITHDKTTGKIFDGDLEVSRTPYSELAALRRRSFPDAGMDLFEPLMYEMKKYPETPVLIEIKPQEDTYGVEEIVRQLKEIAQNPDCQPAFTCIMGYMPPYIGYVHRKIPRMPVAHCTGGKNPPPSDDGACAEMLYRFYTLTQGWNAGYNIYNTQINRLFCEHCRLRGLTIFVWTYAFKRWDEVGECIEESYTSGIDGLTTDFVDKFAHIPMLAPVLPDTAQAGEPLPIAAVELHRRGERVRVGGNALGAVIWDGDARYECGGITAGAPGLVRLSVTREYTLDYGRKFTLVSEPRTILFK